uniref:Uncharacterized protein n=1 Tax=Ananas comosus var. bracteatus TaxID=296719 RepID=A0A6V7P0Z2_ANACO|nr:unnamed protein product [Ananas comosus var. bracteatus]
MGALSRSHSLLLPSPAYIYSPDIGFAIIPSPSLLHRLGFQIPIDRSIDRAIALFFFFLLLLLVARLMPIIHGDEGEIGSDAARRGTSDAVFNAFARAALLKRHEPAEALLASRRAPWLGEALKKDPEKASGRLAVDYSRCSSSYSGIFQVSYIGMGPRRRE